MRTLLGIGILLTAMVTIGCEKKVEPAKRVPIKGTVKLDGKDLSDGNVTFDPMNGEPPAVLTIQNGKFEGQAVVGKNKVTFAAYRKDPKLKFEGPGAEEATGVNILPPRYHAESKMEQEVTQSGPNEFSFELQSK